MIGWLAADFASPAVAMETCMNAAVRAQNASTALPDCRGYELVTPPYKEGFSVDPGVFRFNDDGVIAYQSTGSFAGNTQGAPFLAYHATRSATGWVNTALSPPEAVYATGGRGTSESSDLSLSLWTMSRRDLPGDKLGFYVRDLHGVLTRVGDAEEDNFGGRLVLGASDSFSHILFNRGGVLSETVFDGHDAVVRPVSVDNLGHALGGFCPNRVAPDGRVIVYTTGCNGGGITRVWARVGASATVAVSESHCTRTSSDRGGACNAVSSATYTGGALDGSRLFFTTSQQLVNSDTDASNDLYACDVPPGVPTPMGEVNPCASLTAVSGAASNAEVESAAAVSKDGSQVYFVAKGVLADNLGVDGFGARAGFSNLYVWERDVAHPAGETRFVVSLLGGNDVARAQVTPDGRYLLFLTASKLVTKGPGADADDEVDAYRYDSVTKAILRVSTSVSGNGGNTSGSDVSMIPWAATMSADGSTVMFDTDEALSADDTDGVTDVYAWHDDGRVALISGGGGNSVGISPSGRDVFFTTNVPLLAVDGDFNTDIYDARLGGGFAKAETLPCSGDGCQGQRSQPPSLPGPLAPTTDDGGVLEASPTFSLRAVSAAQRKRMAATGKVNLTVTTNAPGIVTARATATVGGRLVTVGSARRTLMQVGRVAVSIVLSQRARQQLLNRGRLTVRVAVSHSKVALDRSVVLRLVRAQARAKRSVGRRAVVGQGGGRS
jgi:hypothetical protein